MATNFDLAAREDGGRLMALSIDIQHITDCGGRRSAAATLVNLQDGAESP